MDFPNLSAADRDRIAAVAESYVRLLRHSLYEGEGPAPEGLWQSPLAIVAHDIAPDPVFFYGNRTALTLFEMDFASFTRLPSRFSAEPLARDERARALERVARDGFIDDYAGIRISSTGRRFRIERATVWNVTRRDGAPVGQAAAFARWHPLTP